MEKNTTIKTFSYNEICNNKVFLEELAQKIYSRCTKEDFERAKEGLFESAENAKEISFSMMFSKDGETLYVSTSGGVRAFDWRTMIMEENVSPKPIFAFSLLDYKKLCMLEGSNCVIPSYIYTLSPYSYDLDLDELNRLLLFANIDGSVCYVELKSMKNGIFLEVPGNPAIVKIKISPDKNILAITACYLTPGLPSKPSVQLWNYQKLLEKKGLL